MAYRVYFLWCVIRYDMLPLHPTRADHPPLFGRHAAAALDAGDLSKTLHAAMAKRFATDTCFGVANDALQLLGGYGCFLSSRLRQALTLLPL